MLKLEARPQPSKLMSAGSPLLALAITVVIGVVLFMALGKDPVKGLQMFFVEPVKSLYALSELSVKATPLVLIALGLAVCFRANVWNIGAEGQFILGALCAGWVAMQADAQSSRFIVVPVLLAGVAGGMLWAGIVALLRDRFNATEILVSLMLVYVAELLLAYLVYGPWKDPQGYNFPQTINFLAVTKVPRLVDGLRANIGVWLALAAVALAWVFMFRSFRGFQLQVGGLAAAAARYAGYSSRTALWTALLASGGMAGLAGALEAAGPLGQLTPARAGRLRLRRHHRGLRRPAAPGGHRVCCGVDEHVLHRRRTGPVAPGPAQGADRRVPGLAAVRAAGVRHAGSLPSPFQRHERGPQAGRAGRPPRGFESPGKAGSTQGRLTWKAWHCFWPPR